jgi:hypothetical protein
VHWLSGHGAFTGKYAEDEDSDSDTLKPIRKLGEESDDEKYDSDKDPAWTPFNVDKNVPTVTPADLEGKRKRVKARTKRYYRFDNCNIIV